MNPEQLAGQGSRWTFLQFYFLLIMFLTETLHSLGRSILFVLQVPLQQDLGLSDTQLGIILGPANSIAYIIVTLPAARLAERYSRPLILSAAILTRAVGTAACSLATGLYSMIVPRTMFGIGDGASQPVMVSAIADNFRARQRGMAMSIAILGLPFGNLIGPVLAAASNDNFGWRTTFLLFSLPGILVAGLIYATVKEKRPNVAQVHAPSGVSPARSSMLADIRLLFSDRAFVLYFIGGSLLAMEIAGTSIFTAAYFVRQFEVSLQNAAWISGFALGVVGLGGTVVGGYLADRLSDPRGRSYVLTVAAACGLSGIFFILMFTRETLTSAVVMLILGNFSTALKNGPVHAAAQNMSPQHMRATTSAVVMFGVMLAAAVGPLIIGMISDATAASSFPGHLGLFKAICQGEQAAELAGEAANACAQASAHGMRMSLLYLSSAYLISAGFLVASAFSLRKRLEDV